MSQHLNKCKTHRLKNLTCLYGQTLLCQLAPLLLRSCWYVGRCLKLDLSLLIDIKLVSINIWYFDTLICSDIVSNIILGWHNHLSSSVGLIDFCKIVQIYTEWTRILLCHESILEAKQENVGNIRNKVLDI